MSTVQDNTGKAIWDSPEMRKRIHRRYAAERRFKYMGLGAVMFAVAALVVLLVTIVGKGLGGFTQTQMLLDVNFDPAIIGSPSDPNFRQLAEDADYAALIRNSLKEKFPQVTERRDIRALTGLVSAGARVELRNMVLDDPSLVGQTKPLWLLTSADVDMLIKGAIDADSAEGDRRIKDSALGWIKQLQTEDRIEARFNWHFFNYGDSREPEMAGVWGAFIGSLLTLSVTLLIAFPVGVCAAIYLEEFAPQNKWTDLIEVNINNLAAVPSIVFGLLGLAVFLNTMGLPRSAPLVGGMTLALITLPTIIIASRAAIKAVPPSIRAAATGLGASKVQVVMHHVLPLAMPGILTGTIIGMAHSLGETAPLLMIGMVAFIVDIPQGIMDPATVLPVQIYIWADSPERAFVEKTSAAILVLLMFLVLMNAIAILLRQKFERRW